MCGCVTDPAAVLLRVLALTTVISAFEARRASVDAELQRLGAVSVDMRVQSLSQQPIRATQAGRDLAAASAGLKSSEVALQAQTGRTAHCATPSTERDCIRSGNSSYSATCAWCCSSHSCYDNGPAARDDGCCGCGTKD